MPLWCDTSNKAPGRGGWNFLNFSRLPERYVTALNKGTTPSSVPLPESLPFQLPNFSAHTPSAYSNRYRNDINLPSVRHIHW
jgi:hypothetical protein